MKISTNHADGTSKVVASNNNNNLSSFSSSSSSSKSQHHHNHEHRKSSSSSGKSSGKSDAGHEAQKTKVSSNSGSSPDKQKHHGISSKNNSSLDRTPKSKDSSSKSKENNHSSKDGKHSSKPKDSGSEKHRESGSISKPKSVSSTPNSSSKISEGKNGLNNSVSKSKLSLGPDKTNKVKDVKVNNISGGDKLNNSSNSLNSSKHKHGSSNKDATKSSSSGEKKKSSGDVHKSGDSSKHKSSEKSKDGDRHKSRDKENHEKDKSVVHIKQEPGTGNKSMDKSKDQKIKIKEEPVSPVKSKVDVLSDDDVPLATRKAASYGKRNLEAKVKQEKRDYESEDEPLSSRLQKKAKVEVKTEKRRKMDSDSDDEPINKRLKKVQQQKKKGGAQEGTSTTTSPKKKAKEEEGKDVWKWWEEEKKNDGSKWHSLEHKGPVFAPDYEPLPKNVKFYYNGKQLVLSEPAEEVASMYAKFLEHDYTTKEAFNKNFFKDWRKVMKPEEREIITDLKKCDFKPMNTYFNEKTEQRKNMTKEEKQEIKRNNEEIMKEYGFCIIDGHKEKIGNFKTEPPGLFRGRGEHPKMGMLKKRIMPEDVIINCSKGSKVPVPPPGHRWKEVRHDNTVTWLACWQENIQNQTKYIMLNPSSKLKGEKDWQKYETARKLKNCVDKIREQYRADWKSKEMKVRQRAVALYFIDKLALRAGNEKEEGETADTVGCCSLRVEHITLHEEKDGEDNVVSFDFLGKDSIRYENSVPVEKRVFKNLKLFMDNKQPGDDLFDRLNTTILNKHLNELMDGLTAKVFRTFNASKTLQEQLSLLTNPDDLLPAKLLSYNRANRAVAILCNHQRAVPKTFGKSMENLQTKINDKKSQVKEAQKELKEVRKSAKGRSDRDRTLIDKKEKALERLKDQLMKLELQATDKEENKQIALGTSKLNYLDPRISVAWCKKWEVPIEKIYNRTQRDKFRWAIEMATPDFHF